MNDEIARDREFFTRLAETNPELVRTLSLLMDELPRADLAPAMMRTLGERVRRIGETMIGRADRLEHDHPVVDVAASDEFRPGRRSHPESGIREQKGVTA